MKLLVLAFVLMAVLSSQAQPSPAAPVVNETNVSFVTNQASAGGAVFTNQTGQSYSVEELATQLRNLRSTVEATLPMLAAFNESASNSTAQNKSLRGRLTDIVSDALNKGGQTNSSGLNNVVGALRGFLNTNNATASANSTDAHAAQQLISLQTELQPVLRSLQDLNVQAGVAPGQPGSTSGNLTPTGRKY